MTSANLILSFLIVDMKFYGGDKDSKHICARYAA